MATLDVTAIGVFRAVLCVSDMTSYSCTANGQFCVKISQKKIPT